MKKKTPYRIHNWPAYNAALSGRGSLTLWIDEEAIRSGCYTGPTQRGATAVIPPRRDAQIWQHDTCAGAP